MSEQTLSTSNGAATQIAISAPTVETAPAVELTSVDASTTSSTQLTAYADASKHALVERVPVTPDSLWAGTNTLPPQDLGAVLSRSYLLASVTWQSSNASFSDIAGFENLDVLKTLLAIPQIAEKVAWYHYFRCKGVKITLRINSTPFHYGLLAMSSTVNNTYWTHNADVPDDSYQFFQNNCVLVDATESDAVDYEIPWCSQRQWYNLQDELPNHLMTFKLSVARSLSMIGSEVTPVRVSIFANFVAPEVAFPFPSSATVVGYSNRERVNKEAREKTKAGTMVSDLSQTFDTMFDKLNSYSDLASKVAPLALLDKPTSLSPVQHIVQLPGTTMTHTTGIDTVVKLGADPEASAAFSEGSLGDQISNPSIEQLVRLPGYKNTATITNGTTVGALIDRIDLSPYEMIVPAGSGPRTWTPTPAWWFSMPFKFWRGGIKVFLYFVCSTMASARIRVAWFPPGIGVPASFPANESGDIVSKVIEITGPTQIEFTVPYISDILYKRNPYSDSRFATATTLTDDTYSIGSLAFYCVTPVVAPVTTVVPTTAMLSFTSLAEDAAFSNYANPIFSGTGSDSEWLFMYTNETTISKDDPADQLETLRHATEEVKPHCSLVNKFSKPFAPIVDSSISMEFGLATSEHYHDVVSLGKRYSVNSLRPQEVDSTVYSFPFEAIFMQPDSSNGMHIQQWVTACHVNFRGSIRHKIFWYAADSLAVPSATGAYLSTTQHNMLDVAPHFVTSRDPNSKFIEFEVPYNLYVPWIYRDQSHSGLAARVILPTTSSSLNTEVGLHCLALGDDFGMGIMQACPLIQTSTPPEASRSFDRDPSSSGRNKTWKSGPRQESGLVTATPEKRNSKRHVVDHDYVSKQ